MEFKLIVKVMYVKYQISASPSVILLNFNIYKKRSVLDDWVHFM